MLCPRCGIEIGDIASADFCPRCTGAETPEAQIPEAQPSEAPWFGADDQFKKPKAEPTERLGYAGFWLRFFAYLIDSSITALLAWSLIWVLDKALAFSITALTDPLKDKLSEAEIGSVMVATLLFWVAAMIGLVAVWFVLSWLYYAAFEGSLLQATPGKLIFGLRVERLNGQPASFFRATGRYIARVLSLITFFIGYILAGVTRKKQALHDMASGCVVVKRQRQSFLRVFLQAIAALIFANFIGDLVGAKDHGASFGSSGPGGINLSFKSSSGSKTNGSKGINFSLGSSEKPKKTDNDARGLINGEPFEVERAQLKGGILTLRQGDEFFADRSLMIFTFKSNDELSGQTLSSDKSTPAPHVHMSWMKPGGSMPERKIFTTQDGFKLRLTFENPRGKKIRGSIRLLLSDKLHSQVSGKFEALIE